MLSGFICTWNMANPNGCLLDKRKSISFFWISVVIELILSDFSNKARKNGNWHANIQGIGDTGDECGLYEKGKYLVSKGRLIHFQNRFQNGLDDVCVLLQGIYGPGDWIDPSKTCLIRREGRRWNIWSQSRRKAPPAASWTQLWGWGFSREKTFLR